MQGMKAFPLEAWDYVAFLMYFLVLCGVGWWTGRREKTSSDDYFLAGRSLPWYVIGSSFIASNISTEHFIGMIGAAFIYGICVAMAEWGNVLSFSLLIWFFTPFLLASRVFTTPEFMEKRFHPVLRYFFALVTVLSNVVAFLAAVLYGGGLALQNLFGWNLWVAIIVLGCVAGSWAIYGGLKSVAWSSRRRRLRVHVRHHHEAVCPIRPRPRPVAGTLCHAGYCQLGLLRDRLRNCQPEHFDTPTGAGHGSTYLQLASPRYFSGA